MISPPDVSGLLTGPAVGRGLMKNGLFLQQAAYLLLGGNNPETSQPLCHLTLVHHITIPAGWMSAGKWMGRHWAEKCGNRKVITPSLSRGVDGVSLVCTGTGKGDGRG